MSTFGRGVRAEYKRLLLDNIDGIGLKTLITVPANANYFIFINKVITNGSWNNIGLYGPTSYSNGSFINNQFLSDFYNVTNKNAFVDFLAPINAVDAVEFEGRIIHSGFSLSGNAIGNPGVGDAAIWYQEIYFGGQHNY